jgi:hypothetical protein
MEKKRSHRAVEKRRRDKINTSIKELETLVPGCKDLSETNKAAVLLKTAEFVANLMQANIELQNQTRRLEDSNAQLAGMQLLEPHFLLRQPLHLLARLFGVLALDLPLLTRLSR